MKINLDLDRLALNDPDERFSLVVKRAAFKGENLRNCYMKSGSFCCSGFVVKMYLHGAQRILGSARQAYKAARFADAALLYFWPYRKVINPPLDSDFNYGKEQAALDAAEPSVLQALKQIEAVLVRAGMTKSVKQAKTPEDLRRAVFSQWNLFRRLFQNLSSTAPPEQSTVYTMAFEEIEKFDKHYMRAIRNHEANETSN